MWFLVVVAFFGFGDAASFMSCSSKWTKVLQTNGSGSIESGSKTNLIDAVLHGAQLQVFVPDWGYASSTQEIEIIENSTDLCAEAIFHISKDSWESFESDAYWYFLLLCTSGYIDKSRWYVGTHAHPFTVETSGQTISRLRIEWFIRYTGCGSNEMEPTYCNSILGNTTCGSLGYLVEAVMTGADIRAFTSASITSYFLMPLNQVTISKDRNLVFGRNVWSVRWKKETRNRLAFHPDGTWVTSTWFTNGSLDVVLRNIGSYGNHSLIAFNASINWLADTCWILAYQHDSTGNMIDGSVEFLRSAMLNGHKVKVGIENTLFAVENLVMINGEISAQLMEYVTYTENELSVQKGYWNWSHISSSGKVENIRYDVGLNISKGPLNYTVGASWFVDSRPWKRMLSTSKQGMVTFGSKSDLLTSIRKGSMLRCVIKFSQTHTLVAQADNVEFSPDGTNIGAQFLRMISYTTDETSIRRFEDVPYWKFTIATTTGAVRQSDWLVGQHTTRKTNTLAADIDWFVN